MKRLSGGLWLTLADRSTLTGTSISSYLNGSSDLEDHAVHLLFSANRWEAASSIIEAIESGTTVVVDRYYYSGIVYSAAKGKAGLTLQWAKAPDVGLPKPDMVVFLDISTETAKARGGYGDERYENEEMQTRVRELFYEVIRMEGKGENMTKIVDASKSADEVANVINRVANDLLKSKKLDEPLRRIEP